MSEPQHQAVFSQNGLIRLCRWLWKHPFRFIWSTLFINVAINIGSTWLIAPSTTKAIPDTSIVGNVAGWIGAHWLFSCLLLTISSTLLFVTWLGSRWPDATPATHDHTQISPHDREYMLKRLHFRYEQMLSQSLQGAVQVELDLAERSAAVQNAVSLSLRLPDQPDQPLPDHTSIVDAYELAQHDLLILGEPGAGKSTLLLELSRHLVQQAEQDTAQPLPVLLPLSSWAAKPRPLQEWLIEQFAQLYDVPQKLSQQWIATEQLLPLLDGLDEMEKTVCADCIMAINSYHKEHLQPVVVCSRTNEYEAATRQEKLSLHTAIVVRPLSSAYVDAHLAALGKPFAALRSALRKNPALQEIATTPLMLQVLMLTYQSTSARNLSHKQAQLQKQIWTDYVQHMLSRKGDIKRYPFTVTITWLSWLARQMRTHNQTIFFLEQLQPDWLPPRQSGFYRWSVRLLFALFVGLFSGLLTGLLGGLLCWMPDWPLFSQLSELLVALGTKQKIGIWQRFEIEPAEALTWSWKEQPEELLGGLLAGLFLGLLATAPMREGVMLCPWASLPHYDAGTLNLQVVSLTRGACFFDHHQHQQACGRTRLCVKSWTIPYSGVALN